MKKRMVGSILRANHPFLFTLGLENKSNFINLMLK